MSRRRIITLPTIAALMGSLAACSSLFGPDVVIRPVEKLSAASQHDMLYEGAVAAINDRNYGRALDYLQTAKERNPNDVKILNALGVVYDKLGRFDLSSRYYTQAAALDPGSRIVAANTAYSRTLQGLGTTDVANSVVPSFLGGAAENSARRVAVYSEQPELAAENIVPRQSIATPRVPDRQPATVTGGTTQRHQAASPLVQPVSAKRLIQSEQAKAASRTPDLQPSVIAKSISHSVVLTGHPLTVINGTDKQDSANLVRQRLSALGWTLARVPNELSHAQLLTTITYQRSDLPAAQALARTLPFPASLVVNSCDCGGVALVVGMDFGGWNKPLPSHLVRKAPTIVAAVAAKQSLGVR